MLPRYRQPPRKLCHEGASGHAFTTPDSYFRQQYYEVIDLLSSELKRRFQQKRGVPIAAMIENVLIHATNQTDIGDLPAEIKMYENNVDLVKLKIQLQMLPDLLRTRNKQIPNCVPIKRVMNVQTLCDVMNEVSMSKEMFSEVHKLLKLFYTIPVTTSTAERSFSALRRLKTYLGSTMSQPRLNNLMLLYIHKDRTEEINERSITKHFIMENERRCFNFGNMQD